MKPKTMILMVVAVTCGLGASYMTSQLLAERSQPEEQEKVLVLVARKNLETGATIKNPEDLFVEKAFIKGEEPKSAILNYDELKGRMLKRSLREGDFISAGDLLSDKESAMAYLLPKGHRAIGIRVNIENIAGGFASLPLSRVDIISTVRRVDDKSSFSQVLLQNVLVLAADTIMQRGENNAAMPATTVTVALTPEEILKVRLAQEFGPLSLVLRPFNDNQKLDTARVNYEEVINGKAASKDVDEGPEPKAEAVKPMPVVVAAPVNPVPAPPKTKTHVVTIINGDRQEQVEYTLDENDQVLSSRALPRDAFPASRVENQQPAAQPAVPPQQPNPPGAANKQGANP